MNFAKLALAAAALSAQAAQAAEPQQPSVVSVHGAFADGSDWTTATRMPHACWASAQAGAGSPGSAFHKLECSTRAAATLKTLTWRVI